MTSYSRQDVLRILQISSRQLQAWERAGLIPQQELYSFQDLGQLRTLRSLREDEVPAASIRDSILAMKAVAGMSNPLLEARVVRTGTRLAFRHHGAMVDPIRRQLLFDFERMGGPQQRRLRARLRCAASARQTCAAFRSASTPRFRPRKPAKSSAPSASTRRFSPSIRSMRRPASTWAPCSSTCASTAAPKSSTAAPPRPTPVMCWPTSISATCSTSSSVSTNPSAAYLKAVTLSPRYADAHYNLALAYERTGQHRTALRHWRAYVKLDNRGPWADHARGQIRKLLSRESIAIASRAGHFIAPRKGTAALQLV